MSRACLNTYASRIAGVLLVLYLVVLGLQSAHVHAEHALVTDCVYCQSDPGHGSATAPASLATPVWLAVELPTRVTPAILAAFYQRPVRGPPVFTS